METHLPRTLCSLFLSLPHCSVYFFEELRILRLTSDNQTTMQTTSKTSRTGYSCMCHMIRIQYNAVYMSWSGDEMWTWKDPYIHISELNSAIAFLSLWLMSETGERF